MNQIINSRSTKVLSVGMVNISHSASYSVAQFSPLQKGPWHRGINITINHRSVRDFPALGGNGSLRLIKEITCPEFQNTLQSPNERQCSCKYHIANICSPESECWEEEINACSSNEYLKTSSWVVGIGETGQSWKGAAISQYSMRLEKVHKKGRGPLRSLNMTSQEFNREAKGELSLDFIGLGGRFL